MGHSRAHVAPPVSARSSGFGLSQRRADGRDLAGATELLVLGRDELGVFTHEDLAGIAQVELLREITEELAVDTRPHQPPVGVDVDLGDAQLRRAPELIIVHALRAGQPAAGRVDARNFFLRHRAGAVHHQREAGQALLDLGQHIEAQPLRAGELERAVAGADGACQRIHLAAGDEVLGLVGVSQLMALVK